MWFYQDREFTEDDIGDNFGFVYLIENLQTNRKYIGKKFFTKSKTKQIKGKKKRSRVSSDWLSYFGSNDILKEEVKQNGAENYRRTILYLCKSKSECSYYESYEIFVRNALLTDEYYNSWISCRINKKNLTSLFNGI